MSHTGHSRGGCIKKGRRLPLFVNEKANASPDSEASHPIILCVGPGPVSGSLERHQRFSLNAKNPENKTTVEANSIITITRDNDAGLPVPKSCVLRRGRFDKCIKPSDLPC